MLLYFEALALICQERDLMFWEICHCLETYGSQRGFGNEVVSMEPTLPQLRNKVEETVY